MRLLDGALFITKMNRCFCLILMNFCLLLSTDSIVTQSHQVEIKTVTGSNMSSISTLLLHVESVSPTEPSVRSNATRPTEHHTYTPIAASTGVTPTPTHPQAGTWFHAGSFFGGMLLALVIILAVTLGYRMTCSRQEVRYRAIEEHDAII